MRLKVRKAKSEDALEAWKLITQLQDFLGLEITPFEIRSLVLHSLKLLSLKKRGK